MSWYNLDVEVGLMNEMLRDTEESEVFEEYCNKLSSHLSFFLLTSTHLTCLSLEFYLHGVLIYFY